MAAKMQIRKEINKLLEGLSQLEKDRQSELVLKKLLSHPKYRQASKVSVYLSTSNEINTEPILRHALEVDKKRCYVPLVLKKSIQGTAAVRSDTRMVMYELRSMQEYEQLPLNHYGIKEPSRIDDPLGRLAGGGLDLVITPGVAFDMSGRRLGHGKGYYDEFFTNFSRSHGHSHNQDLYALGVAFKEQILPEVPIIEGRDVCLQEILVAD